MREKFKEDFTVFKTLICYFLSSFFQNKTMEMNCLQLSLLFLLFPNFHSFHSTQTLRKLIFSVVGPINSKAFHGISPFQHFVICKSQGLNQLGKLIGHLYTLFTRRSGVKSCRIISSPV